MKITELYIKNFGRFSEQHFYIKDGVQVIYGENEYGNLHCRHLSGRCCSEWSGEEEKLRQRMIQ